MGPAMATLLRGHAHTPHLLGWYAGTPGKAAQGRAHEYPSRNWGVRARADVFAPPVNWST